MGRTYVKIFFRSCFFLSRTQENYFIRIHLPGTAVLPLQLYLDATDYDLGSQEFFQSTPNLYRRHPDLGNTD